MLAIKGGKILTITKGVIDNGVVLIENGKIKAVGADVKIPGDAKVINANRKVVMPGLVEAHCHIGITEETVGWYGNDGNEVSEPITPQMRAIDGIKANADEKGLEAALMTGITTAQILPGSANVIGGTGVIVKTAPKVVVDDMILKNPSGMKVAFGENPRRVYGVELKKMPSTRMGVAALLREWLNRALLYSEKKKAATAQKDPIKMPEADPRLEALQPVINKEIPLRVHAHRADDVATAVRTCEEFGLEMSWEHATEGHRVAKWLAEKKISAVWGPSLVARGKWEMRELSFETPDGPIRGGRPLRNPDGRGGEHDIVPPDLCRSRLP